MITIRCYLHCPSTSAKLV